MNLNPETETVATQTEGFPAGLDPAHKPKRKIPGQSIVLGVVLTVSVITLYAMRSYGMRSGMTFADVNVDYKSQDDEKSRTYDRIMRELAQAQQPIDIALTELSESPFLPKVNKPVLNPVTNQIEAAPTNNEALAAQRREQELAMALGSLRLNAVMGGDVPIARINERLYRVGMSVDEVFTVRAIDGMSVTLEADGKLFMLVMEENRQNNVKQRGPVKVGGQPPRR